MLFVAAVSLVSVEPPHWMEDASVKAQAPGTTTRTYAPVLKAVALPARLRSVDILDVSLSPDGAFLAATGRKRPTGAGFVDFDEPVPTVVCVWSIATGKSCLTLESKTTGWSSVIFAPDGQTIASAWGKVVLLHDLTTGRKRLSVTVPDDDCTAVAFSPDGMLLVTASLTARRFVPLTGSVRLWDAKTGTELAKVGDCVSWPTVAWSGDGRFIAWAARELPEGPDVRVWSVFSRRETMILGALQTPAEYLSFSPDSRFLAASYRGEREVVLWELATGTELQRIYHPDQYVTGIGFSPDGRTLASGANTSASGEYNGVVHFWDVCTGNEIGQAHGYSRRISFGSDGSRLASIGQKDPVALWELPRGAQAKRPLAREPLSQNRFSVLWSRLASTEARLAYEAVRELVEAGDTAAMFIRAEQKPTRLSPERITALVARLDDERYDVREKTMTDLRKLDLAAMPAISKARRNSTSAEIRSRAQRLIDDVQRPLLTSPETLRLHRSVYALEAIGSRKANLALEELSEGSQGFIAIESQAALDRLRRAQWAK
jgi:WD40 repeat protein